MIKINDASRHSSSNLGIVGTVKDDRDARKNTKDCILAGNGEGKQGNKDSEA